MAEPSQELVAEDPATNLPAVLGNYRIAKMAPQALVEVIGANVSGGISAFDLERIRVPSGGGVMFAVPTLEGTQHAKEVEGVIVAWSDQRAYWANSFSGAGTPPDCMSRDALKGEGNPGGSCQQCPLAKFGSAVKDGKEAAGQACKQVRLLFVVRPGDMLPVIVAVPPTSLRNIRGYFLNKLANAGIPYYGAITRFTLAEDKNATGIRYSKIEPNFVKQLSDAESAAIKLYSQSIQGTLRTVDATGDDYAQA